jgi:hypothetical protein
MGMRDRCKQAQELELARRHVPAPPFEGLTEKQMSLIMGRGRSLYKWFKAHTLFHNLINSAVVLLIFAADYFALLRSPLLFISPHRTNSLPSILVASFVAGCLHSWILYSLSVFSLHEGAAHNIIFAGTGGLSRIAQSLSRNLCRMAGGEPDYYSACHMAHHAKFGSEDDSEFLNFIIPRRYWLTFLPLAAFINFSDFLIHRPPAYTRGRAISALWSTVYNGAYAYAVYRLFGGVFCSLTMLVFMPHFGFYLDRLRQFTEHNLMPLENRNGARSFGVGFWGIVVGGGPWGQPCHWAHHLVASIPWYQQIVLHRYIAGLLTPRQREQFLIQPLIGFPKMWWQLIRESNRMLRGLDSSILPPQKTAASRMI